MPSSGAALRSHREKWRTVHDALLERYSNASPGSALPSESQLCQQFDVSRITIRRALNELERNGIVSRQQGRGTFLRVRPAQAGQLLDRYDLTGFYAQKAAEGHRVTSTLLHQDIIEAPANVAHHLARHPGAPTVRIDRLRQVDGTVDHINRVWLPHPEFAALTEADLRERSLFSTISSLCGVRLSEDQIEARLMIPTVDDASRLGAPKGAPRLATTSVTLDSDGRAVMYSETVFASPNATIGFTAYASHPSPAPERE